MTSDELRLRLRGPVVAMTTHFRDDLSVDLPAMARLTQFYVDAGVPSVIVAGSTGEFFSLADAERQAVIRTVVDTAAGRLCVIAGTAHSGTQLTINMTRFAEDAGADGAMVTPPYYGYSGFDGLRTHYDLISRATDIGLIIYFSGAVLHGVADIIANPERMIDLVAAGNGHVAGFKDASGDFVFYRSVSQLLLDKVSVMGSNGMGYYLYGHMFGSPCFLTGLGNIWPQVELDFDADLEAGRRAEAERTVQQLDLPYIAVTKATGRYWSCVKLLQEAVGLPGGPMRPPLLDCTAAQGAAVRQTCVDIGLL